MQVVATAGHVDHGKSSLVLALTGTDPDRFAEEQRRGLTIDLGFAHTRLPSGVVLSLVDVPGHVRFLRNMLAGVGGVGACLFVVAANEGWMPQSEEHLRILELLGVTHGVIALTKADLVTTDELDETGADVTDRVGGTFLAAAPVVPVAAPGGRWVAGQAALLAALEHLVADTPPAIERGRARLWVDRVFAKAGSGTVVTGTLTDGTIAVGDTVRVAPSDQPARVRTIETLGAPIAAIGPGHRVALNLVGVDHTSIARGDAVIAPGRWRLTDRVDVGLSVLAVLDHDVSRRGAYVAYIGSGEHAVRLRVLGPDSIAPGEAGSVRLHLPVRLPLLPGDRYVLRESGRDETVGGGEVLDIAPVLPAARARPDRRVERVVAERGWVDAAELELLTGTAPPPTAGRWVVDDDVLTAARATLVERVEHAGPVGLDIAALDERERALVGDAGLVVDGTRVRRFAATPVAEAPVVALLRAGGLAPPDVADVPRGELRDLARRGVLFERDGRWFHVDAIDTAAAIAARLLGDRPGGFTVSQFREAAGITRKHAVPLVASIDALGITHRRGDVHVAGPRLPAAG